TQPPYGTPMLQSGRRPQHQARSQPFVAANDMTTVAQKAFFFEIFFPPQGPVSTRSFPTLWQGRAPPAFPHWKSSCLARGLALKHQPRSSPSATPIRTNGATSSTPSIQIQNGSISLLIRNSMQSPLKERIWWMTLSTRRSSPQAAAPSATLQYNP